MNIANCSNASKTFFSMFSSKKLTKWNIEEQKSCVNDVSIEYKTILMLKHIFRQCMALESLGKFSCEDCGTAVIVTLNSKLHLGKVHCV